jgi:hypothetical protein
MLINTRVAELSSLFYCGHICDIGCIGIIYESRQKKAKSLIKFNDDFLIFTSALSVFALI